MNHEWNRMKPEISGANHVEHSMAFQWGRSGDFGESSFPVQRWAIEMIDPFFRNKNHRAQQHRKILENHVATLVYDGICSYHDLWLPLFKDAKKNRRCWWQGQLLAVPLPQAQQSQFSKTFLWSSACQAEWLGSAVFRSQNHGPEEVDYWPLAMDGL